jgi:glycosyltransferase involved in cell wall biosynthesis
LARVSIVVPTHERRLLLTGRALPSILSQVTQHELEVLVVGDGTDQDTVGAMAEICASDPRVRFWNLPKQPIHENPNVEWGLKGLTARNFGHDQATGEYVGGLDDDDAFTPDHVEVLVQAIIDNDVDFAYGRSIAYRGDHIQHYGHWPPGFGAFCDGAAIWKRSLGYRYDSAGPLERGLPEDADLWTRMIEGGVRFHFVDKVVHHYWPFR